MSSATILTGEGNSSHAAKSKLLNELNSYLDRGEFHIYGGITHAIMPATDPSQKPTHFFSILLVKG